MTGWLGNNDLEIAWNEVAVACLQIYPGTDVEGAHFGPEDIRCYKTRIKLSIVFVTMLWRIGYNCSSEACFFKPRRFVNWFHSRHQAKRSLLCWFPCRVKENSSRVTLPGGPMEQLSVHTIMEIKPIEKVVFIKLECWKKFNQRWTDSGLLNRSGSPHVLCTLMPERIREFCIRERTIGRTGD
jgi:hypothetical protein